MKKIFIVGDSISVHYGPFLEQYLKDKFHYARKPGANQALKNLDIPVGTNNGDSSMVCQYLRELAALKGLVADYLLVNCGLHDIKTDSSTGAKQVTPDSYENNLREMTLICRQKGFKLIWLLTTPADEKIHNTQANPGFLRYHADVITYNEIARKVMLENNVPVIDLYAFTVNLGAEPLYCDHVHFVEPVRSLQAAFIAGWLDCLENK